VYAFFDLQEELFFEIVGDYPAPSFFAINSENGRITVRNDLRSDNLKSTEYTVSCVG